MWLHDPICTGTLAAIGNAYRQRAAADTHLLLERGHIDNHPSSQKACIAVRCYSGIHKIVRTGTRGAALVC